MGDMIYLIWKIRREIIEHVVLSTQISLQAEQTDKVQVNK